MQLIDFQIKFPNILGLFLLEFYKNGKGVFEHLLGDFRHLWDFVKIMRGCLA